MIGRTNTGGGGGGGLNFKVVGNPQPSNPKENVIWVNTDVKITSYDFNATEPEIPVQGMVWISVGTSSSIAFNALKKNGIQVYPISAKQYIGGAWVAVTAMSYQNGEWVEWCTYLYKNGNEYTAITGGWVAGSNAGLTKNADRMSLVTNSGGNYRYASTKNTVDLSSFNTISFRQKHNALSTGIQRCARVGYGATQTAFTSYAQNTKFDGIEEVLKIDISGVSGKFYILFSTDSQYNSQDIYEIWLT